MKLFGLGKDPADALWEYVAANIRSIDDIQKKSVQDGLTKAIQRVNKGLAWGCGQSSDGTPVLEVSADGISSLIPVVQSLVSRAPALKGVSVVAFKQPTAPTFAIETPFGKVDGLEMRWRPAGQ